MSEEKKADEGIGRNRELLEAFEPRRVIPRTVRDGLRELLIEEEKFAIRRDEGGAQVFEEVPEDKRKKKTKEGSFSAEERESLDRLERDIATILVRDAIRPGREMVASFRNIYPYENRVNVDLAVVEMDELLNNIQGLNIDTERSRQMIDELSRMRNWTNGNKALLCAGGTTLQTFFDGLATMASAVRSNPRYPLASHELHELYSSMGEIPGWKLGEEVTSKQDQAHSIMRGISTVYRHRFRNMGTPLADDYQITDSQASSVNEVFGSDEKVDVISVVSARNNAIDYMRSFFAISENADREQKFSQGNLYVVDQQFINSLKSRSAELEQQGMTVWVDGAEWQINPKSIEELSWKIDSGDTVFLGFTNKIRKDDLDDLEDSIDPDSSIALITSVPASLDNLYISTPTTERVQEIKDKLSTMIDLGIWNRLSMPGADVKQEIELIRRGMARNSAKSYSEKVLDEHFLEMARIYLLYSGEGARLCWGFEYKKDDELGGYKRSVTQGGTEIATDFATPMHWLYTEANNSWKEWTHGILPMEKRAQRQIKDHEPGWKPKYKETTGTWKLDYLGNTLETDVGAKFNLTLLDSAKSDGGLFNERKGMDLVKEGVPMSELPWLNYTDALVNRWYITMSQLALAITVLSTQPQNDVAKKFFGEVMGTPRTVEYLELMKRQTLAYRDAGKNEDVEKFLPFSLALHEAHEDNSLPTSLEPGVLIPSAAARETRIISLALKEMSPEGDAEYSRRMASKFENYMKQLTNIGKALSKDISKKKLKAQFGRK